MLKRVLPTGTWSCLLWIVPFRRWWMTELGRVAYPLAGGRIGIALKKWGLLVLVGRVGGRLEPKLSGLNWAWTAGLIPIVFDK